MKRIIGCAVAAASFACATPAVRADSPEKAAKADKAAEATAPAAFVMKAAQGGMYEVKSSEMAATQGASADVKKFAEHMIADHTKANGELTAAATSKGLTVPPGISEKQAEMLKTLGTLQGAAFDAEYVKQQVKAHEMTVALFKSQADNGTDADLKAWAGKTLPALEEHLKHAKKLSDKVSDTK